MRVTELNAGTLLDLQSPLPEEKQSPAGAAIEQDKGAVLLLRNRPADRVIPWSYGRTGIPASWPRQIKI